MISPPHGPARWNSSALKAELGLDVGLGHRRALALATRSPLRGRGAVSRSADAERASGHADVGSRTYLPLRAPTCVAASRCRSRLRGVELEVHLPRRVARPCQRQRLGSEAEVREDVAKRARGPAGSCRQPPSNRPSGGRSLHRRPCARAGRSGDGGGGARDRRPCEGRARGGRSPILDGKAARFMSKSWRFRRAHRGAGAWDRAALGPDLGRSGPDLGRSGLDLGRSGLDLGTIGACRAAGRSCRDPGRSCRATGGSRRDPGRAVERRAARVGRRAARAGIHAARVERRAARTEILAARAGRRAARLEIPAARSNAQPLVPGDGRLARGSRPLVSVDAPLVPRSRRLVSSDARLGPRSRPRGRAPGRSCRATSSAYRDPGRSGRDPGRSGRDPGRFARRITRVAGHTRRALRGAGCAVPSPCPGPCARPGACAWSRFFEPPPLEPPPHPLLAGLRAPPAPLVLRVAPPGVAALAASPAAMRTAQWTSKLLYVAEKRGSLRSMPSSAWSLTRKGRPRKVPPESARRARASTGVSAGGSLPRSSAGRSSR